MHEIDIQELRDTMPSHAQLNLVKGKSGFEIECDISWPSLSEADPMNWEKNFQDIKDKQKQIVGDILSEIYTLTEGQRWIIYLKRMPVTFINI